MKKSFIMFMITLFSLMTTSPALAEENSATGTSGQGRGKVMKEIKKEIKEEKKEMQKELKGAMKELKDEMKEKRMELKDKMKNKEQELRERLANSLTVRGELMEIKGTVAPIQLVLKVTLVRPENNTQKLAVYPEKNKLLTVEVTDKTRLVRRYNGKSSLEELTVGDMLEVVGELSLDGTLVAQTVKDSSIQITHRIHNGIVASLDSTGRTFVLNQANKVTVTVKVSDKTKMLLTGRQVATWADVAVNSRVHVRGVINVRTKVVDATLVRIVPAVVQVPTPAPTPTTTPTSSPAPTPTPTSTPTSTPPATTSTTTTSTAPVATEQIVTYTEAGFSPAMLTVKSGATVVFKNSASSSQSVWVSSAVHPSHTAYPTTGGCIGSTFDSCKSVTAGESWSFKFDLVGSWKYHNHLNATQTGTIVVE